MSKIYCIGDIHGKFDELNALLNKLNIQPTDTVICLGDYVDRGPNTYGVIERLLELKKQCNCVFLKGNHDEIWYQDILLNNHINNPIKNLTFYNQGARETLNSYQIVDEDPKKHLDFFKELLPYYIIENNTSKRLFVHGGFNRHQLIKDQGDDVLLWDRDLLSSAIGYFKRSFDDNYPFKNKDKFNYIYVGHTPIQHWGYDKPTLFCNVWGCDTGVGKYEDAILYALEINTNTLIC